MPKSTVYPRRVLEPAALKHVQLKGGFWGHRQKVNSRRTLPAIEQLCRETGRLDVFKLRWKPGDPQRPHMFWDSDVAKWIEAAAYSLVGRPDKALEERIDQVVEDIARAQQPDGYLNSYFTVVEPEHRWSNLRDNHELYCAGHLMEAAVAYAQATGKTRLLEVLCRYADHIAARFGPGPDQVPGYCGHPEIELALVRLYRQTGQKKYLDLAKFFIDQRGQSPHFFDWEAQKHGRRAWAGHDYYVAHMPVRKMKSLEGHAVRALYLLSGMIDVAAETGDQELWRACRRLWRSLVYRRMHITGGVGALPQTERFTFDYDLPNETAYLETCAAVALAFAAHRMLQIEPDSRYADVLERVLYNAIPAGVSLSGDRFFYANPLTVYPPAIPFLRNPDPNPFVDQSGVATSAINLQRQRWFHCACCPPNAARLIASLGQYIYSTASDGIYVHLFAAGRASLHAGGRNVELEQETDYPWDGRVRFVLRPDQPTVFSLAVRIPGWCEKPQIRLNGKKIALDTICHHGYAVLRRRWEAGDLLELNLPMPVRLMQTHPRCRNNVGKVALMRGPVVYCVEEVDNGPQLHNLVLPRRAHVQVQYQPRMLGGIVTLSLKGFRIDEAGWSAEELYRPAQPARMLPVRITAVPYCVWGNRRAGEMRIWLQQQSL